MITYLYVIIYWWSNFDDRVSLIIYWWSWIGGHILVILHWWWSQGDLYYYPTSNFEERTTLTQISETEREVIIFIISHSQPIYCLKWPNRAAKLFRGGSFFLQILSRNKSHREIGVAKTEPCPSFWQRPLYYGLNCQHLSSTSPSLSTSASLSIYPSPSPSSSPTSSRSPFVKFYIMFNISIDISIAFIITIVISFTNIFANIISITISITYNVTIAFVITIIVIIFASMTTTVLRIGTFILSKKHRQVTFTNGSTQSQSAHVFFQATRILARVFAMLASKRFLARVGNLWYFRPLEIL